MYEKGVVLSSKNGQIKVRIVSNSTNFCDKCSIKGICQQRDEERIITLPYNKKLSDGTEVWIKINEGFSILLAFLIFILPLLIFFLSLFILLKIFSFFVPYAISLFILVVYFIIISFIQKKLISRVRIIIKKS